MAVLSNELQYEKAITLYLQLRKNENGNQKYARIRNHLRNLIIDYEKRHWSNESQHTEDQILENDTAERLVRAENEFHQKRKEIIQEKLKSEGMNQTSLAIILGHRKSYMSELINGWRPFSKDDIIVISRLFGIKLEDLIPPFIKEEKATQIRETLKSMGSSLQLVEPE